MDVGMLRPLSLPVVRIVLIALKERARDPLLLQVLKYSEVPTSRAGRKASRKGERESACWSDAYRDHSSPIGTIGLLSDWIRPLSNGSNSYGLITSPTPFRLDTIPIDRPSQCERHALCRFKTVEGGKRARSRIVLRRGGMRGSSLV